MVSRIRDITVDCTDAKALGWFWAQALGWQMFSDEDPEVLVAPSYPNHGDRPGLLFIPVPEPRTVKNRMHLDLEPTDRTREEEVARVLELGATVVEDHRNDDGTGWVWMADPEGNDFCVLRSTSERGPAAPQRVELKVTDG